MFELEGAVAELVPPEEGRSSLMPGAAILIVRIYVAELLLLPSVLMHPNVTRP